MTLYEQALLMALGEGCQYPDSDAEFAFTIDSPDLDRLLGDDKNYAFRREVLMKLEKQGLVEFRGRHYRLTRLGLEKTPLFKTS